MSESLPPTPPAPPVPPRRFHLAAPWWFFGLVIALAAAGATAALWSPLSRDRHEVRALVNLREPPTEKSTRDAEDYESYRREQVFILKTRDLLTRTANDPAVKCLGMITGVGDPVRLLEENLSVSASAPSILVVTLKGDNIDEMKVVVDALVKRYVDDATAAGRRSREDQRKKLERLEQTLKDEAEAVERQMKLIATTGATGGESSEKRLAALRTRIGEMEAEINRNARESAGLGLQIAQAKAAVDKATADPLEVARVVDADPRVAGLLAERGAAVAAYQKARLAEPDAEGTKKLGAAAERADKVVAAVREVVRPEAEVALRAAAVRKAESAVTELAARAAYLESLDAKLKFDRDTLAKTISGTAVGSQVVADLMRELEPQREAIAGIRTQLVQLRLKQNLDNNENVREFAQALPDAGVRVGPVWSAGIAFAAAFVLVTLFRLATRAFRPPHRVA